MGSPTAELARKLMNKEANKLAKELQHHKPEEVEALIDAAKTVRDSVKAAGRTGDKNILDDALAKFAPKPEKVYVLPEWFTKTKEQFTWCQEANIIKDEWDQLRELTATEPTALKWSMPTWRELPKAGDADFLVMVFGSGDISYSVGRSLYEAIRDKIMAMND